MKSEIIHADGRHIDLAAAIDPDTYAELEKTVSHRVNPVLRCGGCGGGICIKHGSVRKDELFGAHHNAGTCTETLVIRKSVMSDEHKRQAEYHALAAERAGHVADLEVATAGNTRVDVVVDGRVGFEIQRSALRKAAAVDRTARSVKAGLGTVAWFTDRTTSPQWTGHVPGYRTLVPASVWRVVPQPGSVTAAGLQIVEAVRCGTRGPCLHRQRSCNRYVPAVEAWGGVHVDDVVTGLAEGAIKPVKLGKYVRLMPSESVALYEELAGVRLVYDTGQPKARALAASPRQECDRPQLLSAESDIPEEPHLTALVPSGPGPCVNCQKLCSRTPDGRCRLCDECDCIIDELLEAIRDRRN